MIERMATAAAISPSLVTLSLDDDKALDEEGKLDGGEPGHLRLVIEEEEDVDDAPGDYEEEEEATAHPGGRRCKGACATLKKLRPVLCLLFAVASLLFGGSYLCVLYRRELLAASEYLRDHAPTSAVYYALIVMLWIVLCLPSTVIELVAGAIFSYPVALLTLTVGKQLGCTLAFVIGKLVATDAMRAALGRHPPRASTDTARRRRPPQPKPTSKRKRTIQAMFFAMEQHPWKITLLLRFLPVPISVKNYGMACLPCPTHVFTVCTFMAGIPFTLIWVHLGESTKSLLEALSGRGAGTKKHGFFAQELALLVVGLVLLAALVVVLKRYTQRYSKMLELEEAARLAVVGADASAAARMRGVDKVGEKREVSSGTHTSMLSPPATELSYEDDDTQSCFSVGRRRQHSRDFSTTHSEAGEEGGLVHSKSDPTKEAGEAAGQHDIASVA